HRIDDERRLAVQRRRVLDGADDTHAWNVHGRQDFSDATNHQEFGARHPPADARPSEPHEVTQSLAIPRVARRDIQKASVNSAFGVAVAYDVKIYAGGDHRN